MISVSCAKISQAAIVIQEMRLEFTRRFMVSLLTFIDHYLLMS